MIRGKYILKLSVFFVVALTIGIGVLICLFAPATNPGFLNGVLYRGREAKDLKDMAKVSRRLMGAKVLSAKIFDKLAEPFSESEFSEAGLEKPEVVEFKTKDGLTLPGWYFKGTGEDVVLVCHNGFGKRLPVIAGYVKMFMDCGLSVLLFDYRDKQEGVKFSDQTTIADCRAAYDYLVKERNLDPDHILIFGREIGAYAALNVARDQKCKAMILEEPWVKVKDFMEAVPGAMAMRLVPESLYINDCLNNLRLVKDNHPPVLVVTEDPKMTGAGEFFKKVTKPKAYLYVDFLKPLMLAPDLSVESERYAKKIKQLIAGENLDPESIAKVSWNKSFKDGVNQAKEKGKFLLVDIGADWCPPCRRMEAVTFADERVVEVIEDRFIAVKLKLEGEEARKLADQHDINSIPTILFFASDGKFLKKLTGYYGPGKFSTEIKNLGVAEESTPGD